ncbi:hypothetical protein EVAR_7606_1 [Eumeta japonica]|uniref:Uncharacterized protein n=1 Tax=Eumeta variegata TaxID=151549 RepID=A0A4C1TKP0_EUMVA|nr:hypothetical protein EVAR_7606_1 [Eumeta japonica]
MALEIEIDLERDHMRTGLKPRVQPELELKMEQKWLNCAERMRVQVAHSPPHLYQTARNLIPAQVANSPLVTSLGLRVSIGGGNYLLYNDLVERSEI